MSKTKDVRAAVDKEVGFAPMVDAAHITVRNIDRRQQADEGEPDGEPAGRDRPAGRQRRAIPMSDFFAVAIDALAVGRGGSTMPTRASNAVCIGSWYWRRNAGQRDSA